MASDIDFVEYVIEQLSEVENLTYRKMFGEYGVYSNGKIFALICDNEFFVKPTNSGKELIEDIVMKPPYKGAKEYILIQDEIENTEWLMGFIKATVDELPLPKPKKKKKK